MFLNIIPNLINPINFIILVKKIIVQFHLSLIRSEELMILPLLKLIWINTSSNLKIVENNEYSLRNALQFEKASNNLFNEYIRIMPRNILYLGLNERNMNKYEKDLITQNNIETISRQEISEHYKQTTDRISNFIDSAPVHISVNFNILETISTNSLVNIFNCYELHENKIGMDIIGKETYSPDKNLMNKII